MSILKYPDPVLEMVAKEVEPGTVMGDWVREMNALLLAHGGFGLSAPQVGISRRFFVLNLKKLKKMGAVPYCGITCRCKESLGLAVPCQACPRVIVNPSVELLGPEDRKSVV